jgi:UDP-N-acetylglucosamine 1-carboxyvinyltransferase
MSILRINGGLRLDGVINVHGAKNSVLPILAASILSKSETVIRNCPDLTDVNAAIKILRRLGCKVTREGDTVCVDSREMTGATSPISLYAPKCVVSHLSRTPYLREAIEGR